MLEDLIVPLTRHQEIRVRRTSVHILEDVKRLFRLSLRAKPPLEWNQGSAPRFCFGRKAKHSHQNPLADSGTKGRNIRLNRTGTAWRIS